MILSLLYCLFLLPPDAPPAGTREEPDRDRSPDLLVRADDLDLAPKKSLRTPDNLRGFPASPGIRKDAEGKPMQDFRPPRDKAADEINKGERRFATKNQDAVVKSAREAGKPVLYWSFWPDSYDTTAEYFLELSEVQHVLMTEKQLRLSGGGEWIVYRREDGTSDWIKASDVFGAGCAAKVRTLWSKGGESGTRTIDGDPARLTTAERDAVLATSINVEYGKGGRQERMTIRECVAKGGKMTAEICEKMGLSPDETAYAVGLSAPSGIGRYDGTAYSGGGETPYARGAYSVGASRPAASAYSMSGGYGYPAEMRSPAYGAVMQAPRQMMRAPSPPPVVAPRMQMASAPLRGG